MSRGEAESEKKRENPKQSFSVTRVKKPSWIDEEEEEVGAMPVSFAFGVTPNPEPPLPFQMVAGVQNPGTGSESLVTAYL